MKNSKRNPAYSWFSRILVFPKKPLPAMFPAYGKSVWWWNPPPSRVFIIGKSAFKGWLRPFSGREFAKCTVKFDKTWEISFTSIGES